MAKPYFSVLIDTYNHERFIEEAVQSVLAQDFPPSEHEILVVDDGSTDRTPELLHRFEPHIRILRKQNGGQASAFNAGIPECSGEVVAFLDGDDWWGANKLAALDQAFSAHPAIGLIGHSITEVLSDGTHRSELVRDEPRFQIDSVSGAKTFRLRKSFMGTSRMAFRMALLRRIGQVPEDLIVEADEFLFTLGAVFSEVLLLREPLTFYRLHGQNLFQVRDGQSSSLRRKRNVLLALAESLARRFNAEGISPDIQYVILDAIETEAGVVQLLLGEGSPLDTFRTELHSYDLHYEKASVARRIMKVISLLPALVLAPRHYAALKKRIFSNSFFSRVRKSVLPVYQPDHIDRTGNWNS